MTIEERVQRMLGAKDFEIAVIATQLEQANEKIKELEKSPKENTDAVENGG